MREDRNLQMSVRAPIIHNKNIIEKIVEATDVRQRTKSLQKFTLYRMNCARTRTQNTVLLIAYEAGPIR